MNERRHESRFLCADLIKVEWWERNCVRTVEVVLEDISRLGICVQADEQIPPGVEAAILMGLRKFRGEVTYCVYREYGYFVGIRLGEESRWSSGLFTPRHMIDLAALAEPWTDETASTVPAGT